MKFLLLTILLTSAAADKHCKGIFFNDNYFDVEILKDGVLNIHQMVFNNNENTLYFTFEQLATIPTRALGYLNLDTKEAGVIHGVKNATGLAIDHKQGIVYIGCPAGLFFLNQFKFPLQLPVRDEVHYLFYKDVLYFINGKREAYKYQYRDVEPLSELEGLSVDKLIADDDNNIFFLQNNTLSRVKIGTRIVNTYEKHTVKTIATDLNYKPYISSTTGVYVYNKYKYTLDKVSNIIHLRELTFNWKGEPIYVVVDHIVKLNYSLYPCLRD